MRIGYLLNTYPMTSTTFIPREIHALERQGVEVKRYAVREWDTPLVDESDVAEQEKTRYLLTGNAPNLIVALLLELLTNLGGVIRALGPWFSLVRAARGEWLRHFAYLMQAAFFRRQSKKDGIDHVHAHFGANATAVAMLAHLMGGPRYSFMVHGPDELRESVLLNYPEKIKHASFVAAISHFCRSQLILFCEGRYAEKIKIIHCGLKLDDFTPGPAPQNHDFICVGRLCPQKGQAMIPAAIAAVKTDFPNIHVHLIGDGDTRADIEAEIARMDVADNTTLHGWKDSAAVRDLIAGSRIFLLPSSAEGLPVVLMEAFALGRPAISTYIAGIPELVDASCGWLVPASDEAALAGAMREALSVDDARYGDMAAEGRKRVEASHDVDVEAARLLEYFRAAGNR